MKNSCLFYGLYLLVIITSACTETSNEAPTTTAAEEVQVEEEINSIPQIDTTALELKKEIVQVDYAKLDSLVKPMIDTLLKTYKHVHHYVSHNDDFFFYVSNGNPLKFDYQLNAVSPSSLMGLVNSNSEVILEAQYDRIGNPGAIHPNFVEVFINDKVFLKALNSTIQFPEMDFVFPYKGENIVAKGQLGKQQFNLLPDGSVEKTNTTIPLANILAQWPYDIKSPRIQLLVNVYEIMDAITLTYITPSYVNILDILPSQRVDIHSEHYGYSLSVLENHLKVDKLDISENKQSIVSDLFEYGVDARDYSINQKHLTVVDKNNKVLSSELLYNTNTRSMDCKKTGFNFITSDLIEVMLPVQSELDFYQTYVNYSYYEITTEGKLKKLENNRLFDCTAFVKMDDSYFRGCYSKALTEEDVKELEKLEDVGQGFPDYVSSWRYEYISVEALDVMRNEIFASYGYKFKTEKWHNYFSEKAWYKPEHENVDDQLTEIDKHNIELILEMKKKMQANPENYDHREYFIDGARLAG